MSRSGNCFFRRGAFFGFLAAVASLVGCGGGQSAADKAIEEGVLLINTGAEPRDLDPHLVTGMPENRVIKSLLEGLATEHPTDSGRVLPGMAERWESDARKQVWTFYLRDAQWSNGDPVTAHDFAFAYERILNPELGASYAGMLFRIENAEAFNAGDISDFSEVGVEVIDEKTLRIHLDGPAPYFPLMLTHYTWFPVHPPTIEKFDAFASRGSGWTRPENYVGNGPFRLVEWSPNQRIQVVKSETYWDRDSVALNGITFFPVQDRQTENRMLETGQLHITNGMPFNLRDRYRQNGDPRMREDPMFATGYIGVNTLNEGLTDARVREALSLVIDRQTLIENVTKNGAPAEGFVPPYIGGYAAPKNVGYDPERARQLLVEAGHPNGDGLPEFEIIIANADTSRVIAEVLQAMWKDELNIDVRISNKEWQVLIAEMDAGNFDFFLLSWIGDYLDPGTFLKIMRTGDGNNRTGFANERYDALISEANQAADLVERYRLLAEAETILLKEKPILPLTWSNNLYLMDERVSGWGNKPLMDQPYKAVRLGE